MAASQKPILLLTAALLSTPQLHAQSVSLSPRALVEKATALREDTSSRTRYTYFKLSHLKNSYKEHVYFGKRLFVDITTLYEYTWIGDLAYGRVVVVQGKPLTGDALVAEQARYDQAVADHSGLGEAARAKIDHLTMIGNDFKLKDLLTPAYTLTELRQEQIAGTLTHVIDCVPTPSTDALHPPPPVMSSYGLPTPASSSASPSTSSPTNLRCFATATPSPTSSS